MRRRRVGTDEKFPSSAEVFSVDAFEETNASEFKNTVTTTAVPA
jgi:hypothetical protein